MKIAIDAMGGDHAPGVNVLAAVQAAKEWPDTEIVLIGDEKQIRLHLKEDLSNLIVVHTDDKIESDDEPAISVRRKKNASMVVAARYVREGTADAMISAGNTGALMASGLLVVGRIHGIDRPALASMIPTKHGRGLLALDMGSNMDATPDNLLQYAVMGSVYRMLVHGMTNPRIGLLNVGTEENKGNELTKLAYPRLSQETLDFVGNIEARDIYSEICDVLVTDGFSGNILLKCVEGTAQTLFSELKDTLKQSLLSKLAAAILKPSLRKFAKRFEYSEYGGAPLLGVNGLVLKCHGSSNARAVKIAVGQARTAISGDLVGAIKKEITKQEVNIDE